MLVKLKKKKRKKDLDCFGLHRSTGITITGPSVTCVSEYLKKNAEKADLCTTIRTLASCTKEMTETKQFLADLKQVILLIVRKACLFTQAHIHTVSYMHIC